MRTMAATCALLSLLGRADHERPEHILQGRSPTTVRRNQSISVVVKSSGGGRRELRKPCDSPWFAGGLRIDIVSLPSEPKARRRATCSRRPAALRAGWFDLRWQVLVAALDRRPAPP